MIYKWFITYNPNNSMLSKCYHNPSHNKWPRTHSWDHPKPNIGPIASLDVACFWLQTSSWFEQRVQWSQIDSSKIGECKIDEYVKHYINRSGMNLIHQSNVLRFCRVVAHPPTDEAVDSWGRWWPVVLLTELDATGAVGSENPCWLMILGNDTIVLPNVISGILIIIQ